MELQFKRDFPGPRAYPPSLWRQRREQRAIVLGMCRSPDPPTFLGRHQESMDSLWAYMANASELGSTHSWFIDQSRQHLQLSHVTAASALPLAHEKPFSNGQRVSELPVALAGVASSVSSDKQHGVSE